MIKHACDFCGKELPLDTPIKVYKVPMLNKIYPTTRKGIKILPSFITGISSKEIELCNSCELSFAKFLEGILEHTGS